MKGLLNNLTKNGYVQSQNVYDSLLKVDRAYFTKSDPYDDCPQSINFNATISAPHMHAFALEYLKDYLKPGNKVLDVGSGSGYLCAAFSKMMDDKGLVVGIEHISELYKLGYSNIVSYEKGLLENKIIILEEGDGREGCEKYAKYNCIHVGAAAKEIPKHLIDQLENGGRLMIPVEDSTYNQYINIIDKDLDGKLTINKVLSVRYVPLTSKEKQLKY